MGSTIPNGMPCLDSAHARLAQAVPVSPLKRLLVIIASVAWVAGISWGISQVRGYESTPGKIGTAPRLWPKDSLIHPASGRPILIMMVHPKCSCTLASLDELNVIMNRMRDRVAGRVIFIRSAEIEGGVERTSSWAQAQRIPGVSVLTDPTGAEAARFGALTSGDVVVYDGAGHLVFSGGITGSRGHEGDNLGRQRVLTALEHGADQSASHEVYGCPL